MRLSKKQQEFSVMIAKLVLWADERGYGLTYGDAYRDQRVTYGHKNSLHRKRLAVDFNLFLDGEFMVDGVGHNELHTYWDSLGGSKRIDNDLNHYSLEHGGMR